MKTLIAVLSLLVSFSASADIGDTYTVPAKIGRHADTLGLFEIVGLTVIWTPSVGLPKLVKAAVDMTTDGYGNPMNSMFGQMAGGIISDKFMVGLIYDPATNVAETQNCLGKDMVYTSTEGNGSVCYVVQTKDVVIK
jgi:hypothetical protein